MNLSIIIPALNEEENLPNVLQNLQIFRECKHEIIVVDGGSTDNTCAIAHENADTVIASEPGRAIQMNAGAAIATGDVLLFLHADTILPENIIDLISSITDNPHNSGLMFTDVTFIGEVDRWISSIPNPHSKTFT